MFVYNRSEFKIDIENFCYVVIKACVAARVINIAYK